MGVCVCMCVYVCVLLLAPSPLVHGVPTEPERMSSVKTARKTSLGIETRDVLWLSN